MNKLIRECIIVAKKVGDAVIMAKNRDRAYKPQLEIVHEIVDGVEAYGQRGYSKVTGIPRATLQDWLARIREES